MSNLDKAQQAIKRERDNRDPQGYLLKWNRSSCAWVKVNSFGNEIIENKRGLDIVQLSFDFNQNGA